MAFARRQLEAIVALALGVLVRNEPIRGLEVLGCVVLLVGAWLVSRNDRRLEALATSDVSAGDPG
jgi:drug/metabolite transporter (DMT)-like permease